ncbi:MAG: acyl carrier protein [Jatrophihabitantaceae bacterium]
MSQEVAPDTAQQSEQPEQPEQHRALLEFLNSELVDLGVEQDAISPQARIDELDIDSLDVADLMTSIKRDYGVEIPRRDLVGITLDQLVDRVLSERPAS